MSCFPRIEKGLPMAFAVGQGGDARRDGLKSVSTGWILLDSGMD